jgi:uncharacterized FlaG/YvyC family protein
MAPITAIQGRTAGEFAGPSTQMSVEHAARAVSPGPAVAEPGPAPNPVDPARLQAARRDVQALLDQIGMGHRVGFREDSGTGTMVVEVRDRDGRLIRQFPPQKLLNLQEKLADLSGMVIDRVS